MKYHLRYVGALAALLTGAVTSSGAANGPQRADPAAADAPVPATRYESGELSARASVTTPAPSQIWKSLNQIVASYDSMSLTSDMEDATPPQLKERGTAGAPAPAPANEVHQPKAPTVAADPHAHHRTGTTK